MVWGGTEAEGISAKWRFGAGRVLRDEIGGAGARCAG